MPFAAGSGTDAVARLTAGWLGQELGTQVVVENRAGANATIAAVAVARAAPDGHTLFMTTNTSHAANPALMRRLDYDPVADFSPICRMGNLPFWLVVKADGPHRAMPALIEAARARPDSVTYASGNSTGIVGSATIARMTGTRMLHVPYRSTPPAMADIMGGRVDWMLVDLAASLGLVRDGKLAVLGMTTKDRSALMPQIPALAEVGVPGFDLTSWNAIFGPARMAPEVVATLNGALRGIVAKAENRARLAELGFDAFSSTPEELGAFVVAEIARWGEMVRGAGIEPE
ncbi:Bug family tripartite tricarboxylate transporter substrate binding protein [Rhodovarius crocodyli]|uniref:Bug family tripartite tricarboxylate transporter substrate binding protein n=1 Tax=Rhodovarius crocodyli TaxID=1979269 RepID=UPI001F0C7ABE|nr:tripartite tricarboxylate transporter substrate-binding protein [Rhodovarius crocodyli]